LYFSKSGRGIYGEKASYLISESLRRRRRNLLASSGEATLFGNWRWLARKKKPGELTEGLPQAHRFGNPENKEKDDSLRGCQKERKRNGQGSKRAKNSGKNVCREETAGRRLHRVP